MGGKGGSSVGGQLVSDSWCMLLCAQAYLATGSDEDDDVAELPGAVDAERYRKLLLEGADAQQPLHRKGGKDWGAVTNGNGTADEEDQACWHAHRGARLNIEYGMAWHCSVWMSMVQIGD